MIVDRTRHRQRRLAAQAGSVEPSALTTRKDRRP